MVALDSDSRRESQKRPEAEQYQPATPPSKEHHRTDDSQEERDRDIERYPETGNDRLPTGGREEPRSFKFRHSGDKRSGEADRGRRTKHERCPDEERGRGIKDLSRAGPHLQRFIAAGDDHDGTCR